MKSPLLYIGVVVVLVLFAGLITPYFIDWSNYRAEIEAYGERITGRDVRVDGDITVRLLPAPVLRVAGLTVSNPPGATSEHLLKAETLDATFSLAPLLRGKVELASIEVIEPVIEAELTDEGATWSLEPQGGLEQLVAAEDIRLEDVRVTNGVLILRDRPRDFTARLEELDLSLRAPSLAGPFKAQGEFLYDSERKAFSFSLGRRREDRPLNIGLTVEPAAGAGKRYNIDGRLEEQAGEPTFEGRLRMTEVAPEAGEAGKAPKGDFGFERALPFELRSGVVATLADVTLEDMQFLVGSGSQRASLSGNARIDIGTGARVDAKLSARRLDLDALVEDADEASRELGSDGRHVLAQIPRLLGFFPAWLSGTLAIDVDGLVLGGKQIDSVGATVRFAPGRFSVSRAGGRLPGRSQLSLTGTYDETADSVFDGVFELVSEDAKSFVTWAVPRSKVVFDPEAGGARGKLRMKGEIKVGSDLVELIGVEASLDKSQARMGLSFALSDRPSFGMRVLLDDISLDRYLPPPRGDDAPVGEQQAAPQEQADAREAWNTVFGEFDANIVAQAERVTVGGVDLNRFATDLTLRGGELTLKTLSIGNVGGASVEAHGALQALADNPSGRIEASIDSVRAQELLDLAGIVDARDERDSGWNRWARELGGVALKLDLTADGSGEAADVKLAARGRIGGSDVDVEARYQGDLAASDAAELSLAAKASNGDGAELLRHLGFPVDMREAGRGELTAEASGQLSRRVDIDLTVKALGAELAVEAGARRLDGHAEVDGRIELTADASGRFSRAFGLVEEADAEGSGALDLRALVSAKDRVIAVTSLSGTVGETPINLNGLADLSGKRPVFTAKGNFARLSLPWALGWLYHGDPRRGDDAVARALEAVESAGAEAALWSPASFGTSRLHRFALTLDGEAGELALSREHALRGAAFKVSVEDGKLEVADLTGRLAGGRLEADATANSIGERLSVQVKFALDGARLDELAETLGDNEPLQGTLDVSGEVRSEGRSMLALVSAMSGDGRLAIADGEMRNLDADAFANALQQADRPEEVDDIAEKTLKRGDLDFARVTSRYTITNGVVRVEPLDIDGQAARGRATFVIDLPEWRFDSEWQLKLAGFPEAPPMRLVLAGPFGAGARTVDTRDLKAYLTVRALQRDMDRLEEMERREMRRLNMLPAEPGDSTPGTSPDGAATGAPSSRSGAPRDQAAPQRSSAPEGASATPSAAAPPDAPPAEPLESAPLDAEPMLPPPSSSATRSSSVPLDAQPMMPPPVTAAPTPTPAPAPAPTPAPAPARATPAAPQPADTAGGAALDIVPQGSSEPTSPSETGSIPQRRARSPLSRWIGDIEMKPLEAPRDRDIAR